MASTARPAPAGLLTRVVGGLRQAWFGPSQPLSPEAPPDTAGRQFDYPVGYNLRLQPRQDEGTSFADLRGLAKALWPLAPFTKTAMARRMSRTGSLRLAKIVPLVTLY